jgi:hypothetical protein
MRRCFLSGNLNNEEAMARLGSLRHMKEIFSAIQKVLRYPEEVG